MRSEPEISQPDDTSQRVLLVVLACLFALSISVPLAWQRQQREGMASHNVQAHTSPFSQRLHQHAHCSSDSSVPNSSVRPPNDRLAAKPTHGQRHLPGDLGESIAPVVASQPSPYANLFSTDGRLLLEPVDVDKLLEIGSESGGPKSAYQHPTDPTDPPPAPPKVAWPLPEAFQMRLAALASAEQTSDWANQVQARLQKLLACQSVRDEESVSAINALRDALPAGEHLALRLQADPLSSEVNRAVYDLQRRIDVWRAAHELSLKLPAKKPLVISPVVEVAHLGSSAGLATVKVNLTDLLTQVEQYEFDRLPSTARSIADTIGVLQNSTQPDHQLLGNRLEQHYRNANFRVSFSTYLVNRLVPEPQTECAPIDDYFMGTPVWGRSKTFTKIYVRLIPDPSNVRIGVEAWGRVNAYTTAESGPVQIHSDGVSEFVIRKMFLLDDEGVKAKRTNVTAESDSQLSGVESRFERVPLLRNIVNNIAESRFEEMKDVASQETNMRIEREARQHFDSRIMPAIQKSINSFYQGVWEPLVRLGLEPTSIEKRTTDRRAINRLRVGSGIQLAAHTARPRAPSASWASMQIHETVLNNGLQQLELDGKNLSVADLYRDIASRINRPVDEVPDTMPANVYVSFAPVDAIRVRCEDGKATLTLQLAEVRKGKKKWRNLTIKGIYELSINGLDVRLVRNGPILLEGHRLRTRDQIALRGVFSKLLSKSHQQQLLPDDLVNDSRLKDMGIMQATISDGWIGIAMGPVSQAPAAKTARATR